MSQSGCSCLWVTETGAVGDGKTVNTRAIQAALDKAGETGGTVVIPPGVFVSGTLFVRSNTMLRIDSGAALQGSRNIEDYAALDWGHNKDRQPYHFLVVADTENVTICGGGTINGQGDAFWHPQEKPNTWIKEREKRPSPMVECVRSKNLHINDITLAHSPGWTCHIHDCDRVFVRGVTIKNVVFGPNTDGFDITGSHDVMISDCHIETGDDAIVLKTTPDSRTCERVTVTNCVIMTHCVALKLGCGESFKDMRQVTFSNCVVYGSTRAFGLYCIEGATLEDIAITNVVCDTRNDWPLNRPVHIDLRRRTDATKMGRIRNVLISNMVCRTDGRILMTAEDGGMLEDITLTNIRMSYYGVDDPFPRGETAGSAQFSNRSPEARVARGAVVADNIRNLVVRDLSIEWPEGQDTPSFPVVWGRNVRGGLLDCPMAAPSRADVKSKYELRNSEIAVRE